MVEDRFKYFNLSPSESLDLFASLALKQVVNLAPYGARTQATLVKLTSGYLCKFVIKTATFQVLVNRVEEQAEKALERAKSEVLMQIGRWKEQRFSNPMLTLLEERGPPLSGAVGQTG